MGECIREDRWCSHYDMNSSEESFPEILVGPFVHIVSARQALDVVSRKMLLENAALLLAQRSAGSHEPYEL
jgi:hypothetical protein